MIQYQPTGIFMLYRNALFLAVGALTMSVFTYSSVAAPAVKRLGGTNTSNIQNSKVTSLKSPTGQRASSLRMGGYAKPASKTTNGTSITGSTPKTVGSSNSMRISGLHGNIVHGIGSHLSGNHTTPSGGSGGADTSELTQRVIALESQMATKQTTLESGDGIIIDGNTIGLSGEMAGVPERLDTIDQQISDLNDFVNITNYYTIDQTQGYLQQNYYDKPTIDQIISQLPTAKIANNFDPSFLHSGQNNGDQGQP